MPTTTTDPPIDHVTLPDGTRLAWRQLGAGPAVLLVHGWPTSSHLWRNVMMPIGERHRVLALDLPGFSTKPATGRFGFERFERALTGFLDHLGIERVALAGHDLGGPVVVDWALRHPDRVTRLALLNTLLYPEFSPAVVEFVTALTTPSRRMKLTSPEGLADLMRDGVADGARLAPDVIDAVLAPFGDDSARLVLARAGVGLEPSGFEEIAAGLPTLALPVRVVYGVQDRLLPDVAHTMAVCNATSHTPRSPSSATAVTSCRRTTPPWSAHCWPASSPATSGNHATCAPRWPPGRSGRHRDTVEVAEGPLDRRSVGGLVEAIGPRDPDVVPVRLELRRQRAGNTDRRHDQPSRGAMDRLGRERPPPADLLRQSRWHDEDRLAEMPRPHDLLDLPRHARGRADRQHDGPGITHPIGDDVAPRRRIEHVAHGAEARRRAPGLTDRLHRSVVGQLPDDALLEGVPAAQVEQLEERASRRVDARNGQVVVPERPQVQDRRSWIAAPRPCASVRHAPVSGRSPTSMGDTPAHSVPTTTSTN